MDRIDNSFTASAGGLETRSQSNPFAGHMVLVIDQQRFDCDPTYEHPRLGPSCGTEETARVAAHNAEIIAKLREMGVPIGIIYWGGIGDKPKGGQFLIEPEDGDFVFEKYSNSPFREPDCMFLLGAKEFFADHLHQRGVKAPWFLGFHTSRCLVDTALDTLHIADLHPRVLSDCTADGISHQAPACENTPEALRHRKEETLAEMQQKGIEVTDSSAALNFFRALRMRSALDPTQTATVHSSRALAI